MARLEIRFSGGLTGHAQLPRIRPLFIGNSNDCDVLLPDPGVLPVHCSVGWREGRVFVEVEPEAGPVLLNGEPVTSARFRNGDVLRVGDSEIVLVMEDDEREDTDIFAGDDSVERSLEAAASVRSGPVVRGDDADRLRRAWQSLRGEAAREVAPQETPQRLLAAPAVMILTLSAIALVALGVVLGWFVLRRTADRRFDSAVEAMGQKLYSQAIHRFDRYLEEFPQHQLVARAKVLRALCRVGQYVEGSEPSWTNALSAAQRMATETAGQEAFADVRGEFTSLTAQIATAFAERARDRADQESYGRAREALELLARTVPADERPVDVLATINEVLAEAHENIGRSVERADSVGAMDAALRKGDFLTCYQEYQRLEPDYGVRTRDPAKTERLARALELERQAIAFTSLSKNPLATEASAPPGVTLTIAPRKGNASAADAKGRVVFASAAGYGCALDAAAGKVLWRRAVGFDDPIPPVTFDAQEGTRVLVADRRRRELALLDERSGTLIWRQQFDEPFEAAPLVKNTRVFMPTASGGILVLDRDTGRLAGRVALDAQELRTPLMCDNDGQRIYAVGGRFNLYVLSLDDLRCRSITWIGHAKGAVQTPPVQAGRYLVLLANDRLAGSTMLVLGLSEDAGEARLLQEVRLDGWAFVPPAVRDSTVLVATDRGSVYAFAVRPPESGEREPFLLLAHYDPPYELASRAYLLSTSASHVWVAGKGLRKYDFDRQKGSFTPGRDVLDRGFASGPLQSLAEAVFAARRPPNGDGIRVAAVRDDSGNIAWETALGETLCGSAMVREASGTLMAITRSGKAFFLSEQALSAGGFLQDAWRELEPFKKIDARADVLVVRETTVWRPPVGASEILAWADPGPDVGSNPAWLKLPAPLGAPAAVFGDGLLIPGADGRIYWISPTSGKEMAQPFQDVIDAARPDVWRAPAVVDDKRFLAADVRGTLYLCELRSEPIPHLAPAHKVTLDAPVRSPIAVAEGIAYFVDARDTLRAVRAAGLDEVGSWKLPGTPTLGPVRAGQDVFLHVDGTGLWRLRGGKVIWKCDLGADRPAGCPLVAADVVCVATARGRLLSLQLADAAEIAAFEMDTPFVGAPIAFGEWIIAPRLDGSLQAVRRSALSAKQGGT